MKKTVEKSRIKKSNLSILCDVLIYGFLGLFGLICIYPLYYVLINSISDVSAVASGKVNLYPIGIQFDAYKEVIKLPGISRAVFISIARTVLGTLVGLLGAAVPGYIVSRKELWGRTIWYRCMIITMYVGAGLIPGYLNLKSLGFINSFWVYIIPWVVAPYNMILVKTYVESIPPSLEESAYIDGAGYFKRFTRIILPLSKPIIATVAIFVAVGQWNSYMDTLLYINTTKYATLQSTLQMLMSQINALTELLKQGRLQEAEQVARNMNAKTVRFTMTAVTLLPVMMVYPFFQKYFTKGIMLGAVKG